MREYERVSPLALCCLLPLPVPLLHPDSLTPMRFRTHGSKALTFFSAFNHNSTREACQRSVARIGASSFPLEFYLFLTVLTKTSYCLSSYCLLHNTPISRLLMRPVHDIANSRTSTTLGSEVT
eukprot:244541-Rhodomonas_salina.2